MIKASLQNGKGEIIFLLGLSRKNCERLLKGEPIPIDINKYFNADEKQKVKEILIVAGETEQAMADELRKTMGLESLPLKEDPQQNEQKE